MLPVFLQHLSPPVGACGERNYALFFCSIRGCCRITKTVTTPLNSRFFPSKAGRCHNSSNLANDGTASKKRSKGPKTGLVRTLASGSGTILKNAQKLRIGGPGAAHVEVLEGEVRALHIVEPNPSPQGQALNRSIRNRAAKPRVLQQLRAHEGLPTLQANHIPLHRFHGQESALLHLATGPDQSQPRPDSRGLRRIRRHRAASLILHQQGVGGGEPAILPFFDLQHQPPARSCSSWLCFSSLQTSAPAKLSKTAGSCRKSPSSRKRIFLFMLRHAMSAHKGVSN